MSKGANPYSQIVVVAWMILTIIAFGLALAMLGLAFSSLVYVAKNITKIDLMKGTFRMNDPKRLHPNPFDLGKITNFATVFEGQAWTWWLPSRIIPKTDGTRFPMVPPVKIADVY